MNSENTLKPVVAQLSKAPKLGHVKTRMQPELNLHQSVVLHRWLTEHSLGELSVSSDWNCHLWVDEPDPFFQDLIDKYAIELFQQSSGGLGERLDAISQFYGDRKIILIGSDCPFLSKQIIEGVFDSLDQESVDGALIPAHDGGYVGLALKQYQPCLFEGIKWGTDQVASQTLLSAEKAGLNLIVKASLADIDRPEDLKELREFAVDLSEE